MKRPQSSCWLFCHFTEGQQRKTKTKQTKNVLDYCSLEALDTKLMCRWSWPQCLPGAGHSNLWWFSARMSTAGNGFCGVAAGTAGSLIWSQLNMGPGEWNVRLDLGVDLTINHYYWWSNEKQLDRQTALSSVLNTDRTNTNKGFIVMKCSQILSCKIWHEKHEKREEQCFVFHTRIFPLQEIAGITAKDW